MVSDDVTTELWRSAFWLFVALPGWNAVLYATGAVEPGPVTVLGVPLATSLVMAAVTLLVRRHTGRSLTAGDGRAYLEALTVLYVGWFALAWAWLGNRGPATVALVVLGAVAVAASRVAGREKSNP